MVQTIYTKLLTITNNSQYEWYRLIIKTINDTNDQNYKLLLQRFTIVSNSHLLKLLWIVTSTSRNYFRLYLAMNLPVSLFEGHNQQYIFFVKKKEGKNWFLRLLKLLVFLIYITAII